MVVGNHPNPDKFCIKIFVIIGLVLMCSYANPLFNICSPIAVIGQAKESCRIKINRWLCGDT